MTLQDGVLKDDEGRTGYIASNRQFQFDAPPQAGAIFTSGFSVCPPNNFLAIGGKTTWYQCLSGDFYNLYDQSQGGQCEKVNIQVIGGGSTPAPAPTSAPEPTTAPASQEGDGQITGSAVAPVSQIPDGQITGSAVAPVTQITDGQPQAPSAVAPITQITDGQIQAPTSTPVAPITQISDGQIQAPTATASCTQIVDGQPQCPVVTGSIPPYGGNSSVAPAYPSSIVPATGAAATAGLGNQIIGLAAGVIAVAML
jgi:hypothetical protein